MLRLALTLSFAQGAVDAPRVDAQDNADSWVAHYRKGISLLAEHRPAQARSEFEAALALRPEEGLGVPIDGSLRVDYYPRAYLAVACLLSGDPTSARGHFDAVRRSGVAVQSVKGSLLLDQYRGLVAERHPQRLGGPDRSPELARLAVTPEQRRKEPVLSEEQLRTIQRDVLGRCHLSVGQMVEGAPWYFHYELGLELSRRGDSVRALDSLLQAALLRPKPEIAARLYGIWFVDYRPYLQIALAHARLDNRECAREALDLSEKLGEFTGRRKELDELRAVLDLGPGRE